MNKERKIDELGRIVIPAEFRKKLNWKEKDDILIVMVENIVCLKKINKKQIAGQEEL